MAILPLLWRASITALMDRASPWMMDRPTPEEEVEDLKTHIEMLKEELKAAEEDLNELEKST